VATICVQTGLNPARHILGSPCQYVRCHGLNFFGDVCFQGVYGSWFLLVNKTNHEQNKTNPQPNEREISAGRRVRQETGWLAGGPLLRVATTRCTTDTFLFISHTTNVLLFKFRCNIFISVWIIKEMPGSVASGTPCTFRGQSLIILETDGSLSHTLPLRLHSHFLAYILSFTFLLTINL